MKDSRNSFFLAIIFFIVLGVLALPRVNLPLSVQYSDTLLLLLINSSLVLLLTVMGSSSSKSSSTSSKPSSTTSTSAKLSPSDVETRISRAKKIGALDLSHCAHLVALPNDALDLPALRRIDLSHTSLKSIPILPEESLKKLDFFAASCCKLCGLQPSLANARALTQLNLDGNDLLTSMDLSPPGFLLPSSIKSITLASCRRLGSIPRCLLGKEGAGLVCLERLDMSGCGIALLPSSLSAIGATLIELVLDDNSLSSLALVTSTEENGNKVEEQEQGTWTAFVKLSTLSVRRNKLIPVPQSFPSELFTSTKLSVLSLGGNPNLTASSVLKLPGCTEFEKRRAARVSKGITNDVHANDSSFCGLDRTI